MMLCQFGGGGGGAGPAGETGAVPGAAGPAITINDLARVIVNTISSETWGQSSGEGKIEFLGTALIVWQTPAVHRQIEDLLKQIRETSGQRKTLTIDARWLLLTSDELDSLLTRDSEESLPEVDRKALASFTRRGGSIRGLTNCFSGQLVYLVSGTRRNIVSGWIPVVGALENGDGAASLVSSRSRSRIQLVADISPASPAKEARVGYQPIVQNPNLGALLEVRPTFMGGNGGVVVELKSTLTAPSESAAEAGRGATSDAIAPAVDRVAIETQELATTLRVPLGKPTLVGGLTYVTGLMKTNKDSETTERPQLYLVLEIR